MFTQIPAITGLKLFGEKVVAAILREYKQLMTESIPRKPTVGEICPYSPREEDKTIAPNTVNLIKEKRDR